MKELKVYIDNTDQINSISKLISFASEDIVDFTVNGNCLVLYVNDDVDFEVVERKIQKLVGRFNKDTTELEEIVIYSNISEKKYSNMIDIYHSCLVKDYGNGLISLKDSALKLFRFFDSTFKDFAFEMGAIEKSYPTLLPIESYRKTGYLKTSPQYSIFCCSPKEDIEYLNHVNKYTCENNLLECINQPQYALSPAACFHSYMEMEDSILEKPMVITFNQNVFRHEGRFNWDDFGRLKDYHVREIVFFGDMQYVIECRERMAEKTKSLIEKLGLDGRICITYDPFVVPSMQKFKKIQIQEQSKYEMQLVYSEKKYLAVASFNLHGTAFTDPFNIRINGCEKPVTGCIGYGIERWVLAFLSQYGLDMRNWPKRVIECIL